MAEKDGLTELAVMLKQREPKKVPSITTGIVEALPPNPLIRVGTVITLDKSQLVFASSLTVTNETLSVGDEVIIVPVADSQMYYALDKAVRFE